MSSVFPKWSNALPLKLIVFLLILAAAVVSGVTYYATPNYTRVGYEPSQPVPYNHSFHVGEDWIAGIVTAKLKSRAMPMFPRRVPVCLVTV